MTLRTYLNVLQRPLNDGQSSFKQINTAHLHNTDLLVLLRYSLDAAKGSRINILSLEDTKLPFLGIKTLPDKFRVAVTGNSREVTKYTEKTNTTQHVIHVLLENKEGQLPIKNSPPNHFLALSNHARQSLRKKGFLHLDELSGKIVSFKKATVEGFTAKTIEFVKIEEW